MTRFVAAGAALLASTALAHAGGIERSSQSMAILFEEGTYAELGFAFVNPDVSGVLGAPSGNITESYISPTLSYRQDITEALSFAFILDSHVGANVSYPAGTGYPLQGTNAVVDGDALTAIVRYEMPNHLSFYGGVRVSRVTGDISIPASAYTLSADGGTELGYVLGVAYEMPEIAMRVALTYSSEIQHTFSSAETGPGAFPANPAGQFTTILPASVNLEAQSGIAEDTLLFGSIRWVQWSEFDLSPPSFSAVAGGPLLAYANDTVTYSLGVGRRFTENWSGAVTLTHEPTVGGNASNLGPVDGRTAIGLGATWENDRFEITGGIQYSHLNDATSPVGGAFNDNETLAAGLRFGFRF